MIINKGIPPAQQREWSKLGLASQYPLNVNCVRKGQRKGKTEENSNATFLFATNSRDIMSSKGTEGHPQWPSGKGFVGNGRCRSWLADLMQVFLICLFSFAPNHWESWNIVHQRPTTHPKYLENKIFLTLSRNAPIEIAGTFRSALSVPTGTAAPGLRLPAKPTFQNHKL